MKSQTIGDLINTNKVLRKIEENPMTVNVPSPGNLHNVVLKCYSDASLAKLPSGNSTGGYVIFLVGENDESCPLAKTIRPFVPSTVSAEVCAMTEVLDTAHFISKVLSEILLDESINAQFNIIYQLQHIQIMNHSIKIPILQQWLMSTNLE